MSLRTLLFLCVTGVALAAVTCGIACGGSSSETPWPAEPRNLFTAPPGENLSDDDADKDKKDAGAQQTPSF